MNQDCATILTELDINKVYIIKNMTNVKNTEANTIITNPLKRYLNNVDAGEYTLVVQRGEGYYASLKMYDETVEDHNNNNSNNNNTPTPVVGTPYTEVLLNGADPVIGEGMIPVTLSSTETDWKVKYANIEDEWYNYGQSKWANAVILVDNPSRPYNPGDTIKHDDISAYFVWIPKYKYKLFNMGNYNGTTTDELTPANQLIEIEFGGSNTTDVLEGEVQSCVTPMTSGASGNCAVGRWMTHPSFISFNSTGFWVGKFETTGLINSISISPGTTSLRIKSVGTMFESAYYYNRILDSHMMKNTEWGAVAYITNSNYGKGNSAIWINNNSNYITGCIGEGTNTTSSTSCTNEWYSPLGINGSTSGNITGVYDMSGGAWEYMASYRKDTYGESELTEEQISEYNSKYFDVYNQNSSNYLFSMRILGDATGECGAFDSSKRSAWYGNYSYFVASWSSWFERGGKSSLGGEAGLFTFSSDTGEKYSSDSFRLVLTPTN